MAKVLILFLILFMVGCAFTESAPASEQVIVSPTHVPTRTADLATVVPVITLTKPVTAEIPKLTSTTPPETITPINKFTTPGQFLGTEPSNQEATEQATVKEVVWDDTAAQLEKEIGMEPMGCQMTVEQWAVDLIRYGAGTPYFDQERANWLATYIAAMLRAGYSMQDIVNGKMGREQTIQIIRDFLRWLEKPGPKIVTLPDVKDLNNGNINPEKALQRKVEVDLRNGCSINIVGGYFTKAMDFGGRKYGAYSADGVLQLTFRDPGIADLKGNYSSIGDAVTMHLEMAVVVWLAETRNNAFEGTTPFGLYRELFMSNGWYSDPSGSDIRADTPPILREILWGIIGDSSIVQVK